MRVLQSAFSFKEDRTQWFRRLIQKTENIRIRPASYEAVRVLAERTNQSALGVLDQAVEHYRRQCLFEEADAKLAALQRDAALWDEVLKEQAEWDTTLLDGLESEDQGAARE